MSSGPFAAVDQSPMGRQLWSLCEPERIGVDPLLAERGLHAELTQRWYDTGMRRFLLAFEGMLAYLEKTLATEVSDGSTCT
jgi:hypothetical protein